MARNQVFRSALLAAGVLLMAACASQPAATTDPVTAPAANSLLEKKFQRAARHYEKFEYQGHAVYCKRGATRSLPYTCVSEAQLRYEVASYESWRNPVQRPVVAGTGQGGIGSSGH